MPTTAPEADDVFAPAGGHPASTATRGALGSTCFVAASWRSNRLVQGIDTTRTAMPVMSQFRAPGP